MGRVVFYARVSTKDQKLDLQLDAARKLGVKTADIFVEKASSVRHDRPALAKAIAALQPGDTLTCYKLDRIGRSLVHVTKLLADLEERGPKFSNRDTIWCHPGVAFVGAIAWHADGEALLGMAQLDGIGRHEERACAGQPCCARRLRRQCRSFGLRVGNRS
jgi:hypothetical protein